MTATLEKAPAWHPAETEASPKHNVEHIVLGEGEESFDLTIETSAEEGHSYAVLIVGGFLSDSQTNAPLRHQLAAESGQPIATMGYSKEGGFTSTHQVLVDDVIEALNALAQRHENVFIVAHSMGAAVAVDSLVKMPQSLAERIKGLMMVNPSGLIEDDSITDIGQRFIRVAKSDVASFGEENGSSGPKISVVDKFKRFLKARRPARLVGDAITAVKNESIDDIKTLKRRLGEVCLTIVASQGDELFPITDIYESTQDLPIDAYYGLPGGSHFEPSNRPEIVTELVQDMVKMVLGGSALKGYSGDIVTMQDFDIISEFAERFHEQWAAGQQAGVDGSVDELSYLTFDQLSDGDKQENFSAAEFVYNLLKDRNLEHITSEDIEQMAEAVHEEWLSREANDWSDGTELDSHYKDLSDAEKDKDRAQIQTAINILKGIAPKE